MSHWCLLLQKMCYHFIYLTFLYKTFYLDLQKQVLIHSTLSLISPCIGTNVPWYIYAKGKQIFTCLFFKVDGTYFFAMPCWIYQ